MHKLAAVAVLLGSNWISDYGPISTYHTCTCTHAACAYIHVDWDGVD